MAEAIHYEVPPPREGNTARQELDCLVENLHDQGILRFLNDFLSTSPEVSQILMKGLNTEESRNAVQNLLLIAIALGRIPPERFAVLTRAFTEGLNKMEEAAGDGKAQDAPGLMGFYRLLHDRDLWQGLRPIIAGVKGFSGPLREPPEKPVIKRHDESGNGKKPA
ncbi:DUF1641 domain-containing protein [Microbulbifer rhizosphaerae]|uniref:Uncharacterized protein YjgD (DUF1641 family) n=1 Tax=Microbulbifer rhizosphaerae TaxID=1562603 RepID=A0A7W4Z9X1_9GAMM|nr:DUF1641 domain-containing protein [Microbulbifer rhizosphaerae]MBB3060704.1 uncharacterized protein YjgD (DUF1641 family) [Microbulbifer rhizosphaerae]